MSADSDERAIWQLVVSFIIGAIVSIGTANVFGTDYSFTISEFVIPMSWIGFGISIVISIGIMFWTQRIRSNRLAGVIGHVILYSIFSGIAQKLLFQ